MGKIDDWERQIEHLERSLADLEGMEPPGVGSDMNEGKAERIRDQIRRYREMIANYDGEDA